MKRLLEIEPLSRDEINLISVVFLHLVEIVNTYSLIVKIAFLTRESVKRDALSLSLTTLFRVGCL